MPVLSIDAVAFNMLHLRVYETYGYISAEGDLCFITRKNGYCCNTGRYAIRHSSPFYWQRHETLKRFCCVSEEILLGLTFPSRGVVFTRGLLDVRRLLLVVAAGEVTVVLLLLLLVLRLGMSLHCLLLDARHLLLCVYDSYSMSDMRAYCTSPAAAQAGWAAVGATGWGTSFPGASATAPPGYHLPGSVCPVAAAYHACLQVRVWLRHGLLAVGLQHGC